MFLPQRTCRDLCKSIMIDSRESLTWIHKLCYRLLIHAFKENSTASMNQVAQILCYTSQRKQWKLLSNSWNLTNNVLSSAMEHRLTIDAIRLALANWTSKIRWLICFVPDRAKIVLCTFKL